MLRKIKFFLIIWILLAAYGCEFQEPDPNSTFIPSPIQETIKVDPPQPAATATQTPTHDPTPAKSLPTPTQIFLSATHPNQPENQELTETIDPIITQAGGRWHIVIKEIDGRTYYSLSPERRINIASVVKVPLALLFFKAIEEKGIAEDQLVEHLQSTGTGGRTFEQLLRAMLVKSEEDATNILFEYIGEYVNIPAQLREWRLQGIDLEARRATAEDIAAVFERLYQGEFVSLTAQKLILAYLSEYTPNDDFRIGTLRAVIPENFRIYNKRGSLLSPYVVADSAIIENPDGSDYIMIIFAYNGDPETTYEALDQAIGEISLAFWEYISNQR